MICRYKNWIQTREDISHSTSFMQQAILGLCPETNLLESFLKFLPGMDRQVLQEALDSFDSIL